MLLGLFPVSILLLLLLLLLLLILFIYSFLYYNNNIIQIIINYYLVVFTMKTNVIYLLKNWSEAQVLVVFLFLVVFSSFLAGK